MKRIYQTLCTFLVVSLTMTSCLGNDDTDTIASSNETAITGFVLGSLNCYTNSTSSSTGNDTIIKTVLTGSNYPMTIDQNSNSIYNTQEFPVGTDLGHVLISSISTKSNGYPFLISGNSIVDISTSDSIDFRQPRVFRVFSNDFNCFRDYTVTLKVSATKSANSQWVKAADVPQLQNWTNKCLVSFGDSVRLVDKGVVIKGSIAYRMNGSNVEKSSDLTTWESVATASLVQLIGASSDELYALGADGMLKYSQDNGSTWNNENLDDEASLLPVSQIATVAWPYAPIDSADCVLMAGLNQQGKMCFWRKIVQKNKAGQWVSIPIESNNRFTLPAQTNLSLAYVEGNIYAVGDNLTIYVSRDQGITWKVVSNNALPSDAQGTEYVMTNDSKGNLWLVTNAGQIWRK